MAVSGTPTLVTHGMNRLQIFSCCVTGSDLSARSNARRVWVISFCSIRKVQYSIQMRGIW